MSFLMVFLYPHSAKEEGADRGESLTSQLNKKRNLMRYHLTSFSLCSKPTKNLTMLSRLYLVTSTVHPASSVWQEQKISERSQYNG